MGKCQLSYARKSDCCLAAFSREITVSVRRGEERRRDERDRQGPSHLVPLHHHHHHHRHHHHHLHLALVC